MSNIVVTGGAGFIGSWIAEGLAQEGHNVISIDDLSGGSMDNVIGDVTFFRTDCADKERVWDCLQEPVDILVHCVANAREGASQFQPISVTQRNYAAYVNVLTRCIQLNVKSVVMLSSMSVYGNGIPPFSETTSTNPVDVYGVNKVAMEKTTDILAKVHNFCYTIIRPHNCFDSATEILTEDRGWVKFEHLTMEDSVATLNPETECMEWHKPSEIQAIEHDGTMLHFKNNRFDMLVTGDHHLWLKTDRNSSQKPKFVRAEDVDDSMYSSNMSTSAKWVGVDIEEKILPTIPDSEGRRDPRNLQRTIPMTLWLQLLGWFVSEGSVFKTPSNYIVNITQFDIDNCIDIFGVIDECGFNPYVTSENDIRILSKQLYDEFVGMAGAKNKHIPKEIKDLPPHRLQVLLHTLMRGDGTIGKDGKYKLYTTSSKRLADDVQEIAIKLGYRSSVKRIESSGYVSPTTKKWVDKHLVIYKVSFSKQTHPQIGDNLTKTVFKTDVDYKGMVYDVTVQNHIILVRRNGKAVWSGNCFGQRQALFDDKRNVIAIFMNRIMRNEPIIIYGDGLQKRAFSYIADSLPCFLHICREEKLHPEGTGDTVNIGGVQETTILDMANVVRDAMRVPNWPIVHVEDRPCEVKYAWSTYEKSVEKYGYEEKVGWEQGIYHMAEWAKQKGRQEWQERDCLELGGEKLPVTWRNGFDPNHLLRRDE